MGVYIEGLTMPDDCPSCRFFTTSGRRAGYYTGCGCIALRAYIGETLKGERHCMREGRMSPRCPMCEAEEAEE